MNGKSIVILKGTGVFLIIWFIGTLIVFILNFKSHNISDNIEHWGQIGDFIGGILNPCIAIGNIVLLFYISDKVSKIESDRHLNNIKLEDRRHLNEFRYDVYKEIVSVLDKIDDDYILKPKPENYNYIPSYISELISYFEIFYQNNYFLFRSNNEDFVITINEIKKPLIEIKKEVIRIDREHKENPHEYSDGEGDPFYNTDQFSNSYNKFKLAKKNLKYFIQKVMLNVPTS
jgi:hypothetical protein